eukprot:1639612-Rhodomonas_salina.1
MPVSACGIFLRVKVNEALTCGQRSKATVSYASSSQVQYALRIPTHSAIGTPGYLLRAPVLTRGYVCTRKRSSRAYYTSSKPTPQVFCLDLWLRCCYLWRQHLYLWGTSACIYADTYGGHSAGRK